MRAISIAERRSLVTSIGFIGAFTFLMALSAYVRIPLFFTPVPLTMQTFVVYLSLVVLKRRAVFSQLFYLLLGVGGIPVFANGGASLLYLLGPTGGYLLGFLAVALIFPYFLPKEISLLKALIFFSSAAIMIYSFGLSWLIFIHHFSLPEALIAGVYPFIPGAIIKIGVVSWVALKYK